MEFVEFATAASQLLKGELTGDVGTASIVYRRASTPSRSSALPFQFPPMVPMWIPVALPVETALS